jgi:hypothetical protein
MKRLKLDIVQLRWVFVVLYGLSLAGLLMFGWHVGKFAFYGIFILVILATQAIFLFCTGTINLCRPIRKRRAFVPVVITGALMALLFAGAWGGLGEFLFGSGFNDPSADTVVFFWILVSINWIGWGIAFLITHTTDDRLAFIRKQVLFLLSGSLLQLLVIIPAHILTSRRSYCLAGMYTMAAVACGIVVMLWAFGPGIVLLFIKRRER